MAYQYWSYDILHQFCMVAFQKFGFSEQEANIIQDVLLTSDLYGIESHGMQRMVRYHKCIEKGLIQVDAKPEVVFGAYFGDYRPKSKEEVFKGNY